MSYLTRAHAPALPFLAASLFLVAGCLEVQTPSCGDLICPADTVCAPAHGRCVLPAQVDGCAGRADGEPCTYLTETGICDLEVCFAFVCGNGHIEPPEVCDEGDTLDRDGCSADCRSDETCGNGIVDGRVGEQCDDGNRSSGDACQADCTLPRCGDGIVDPMEVCDDGNFDAGDGCSAACTSDETCGNGIIDVAAGEGCDDGNTEPGDGCGAICVSEVCGNGIIDPGDEDRGLRDEVCDDGNTISGDGCNASCLSDETCGNGFIDVEIGEQCDDGNARSHDGCSSQCTIELPFFQQIVDNRPDRRKQVAVYDPSRDRMVVLGGEGPLGEPSPQAILFQDGFTWFVSGPSPRIGQAAAWDASAGRIVIFGGQEPELVRPMDPPPSLSAPLDGVWVMEGERFVPLATAPGGPSGRWFAAMAYHPDVDGVVVFGGEDLDGMSDETWVLSGATWRRLDIPGPPARARHAMVYDSARRRLVMTGGQDAAGDPLRDTWAFDGSAWSNLGVDVPNPPGGMAYDANRDRVVAFGGVERRSSDIVSEFDGTTWTSAVAPLEGRWGFGIAFDARAGEVFVHQGARRPLGPPFPDIWAYDGTWRELTFANRPPARRAGALDWDGRTRRAFLFGGESPATAEQLHDGWLYDQAGFRRLDPLTAGPTEGRVGDVVFDSIRGLLVVTVVHEGDFQTWELDGRRWRRIDTASAPSATSSFSMAFDARRGVLVLFGGNTGGPPSGETWEYDGRDWTRVMGPGPSPRARPGFVFDEERGVCVLFGGSAGMRMELDDTWEYDGAWREVTPDPAGPAPRSGDNLVFDSARRTVVLHGGEPRALTDTWEFDGVRWRRVRHPVSPEPRALPSVTFDRDRDALLMTHGSPNDDTWELRYVSDTPDEICGNDEDDDGDGLEDCADPDCEDRGCAPGGEVCRSGTCECAFATETHCADGHDDDCDGQVDCDDPDCAADAWCTAEADCGDGLDDDDDGRTDCGDPGCAGIGACEVHEQTCGDGVDNDGDGLVDCEDGDCFERTCAVIE